MAGKKKKFQPSKYDWTALEIEFMAEETMGVAKFCRLRDIPKKTYERATVGWGEKRLALRKNASKMIFKGLARDYAEAMKLHLNWGSGVIKLALDALVPGNDAKGKPLAGLKPKTAGEAVKILHLGTVIQRNALLTTGAFEEVMRDKSLQMPGGEGTEGPRPNQVHVVIDLPSNQKELPPK